MKPLSGTDAAYELVARTTAAQGLPFYIEDPVVIEAVAAVFATVMPARRQRTKVGS